MYPECSPLLSSIPMLLFSLKPILLRGFPQLTPNSFLLPSPPGSFHNPSPELFGRAFCLYPHGHTLIYCTSLYCASSVLCYYKLKTRPSNSKKIMISFISIFVIIWWSGTTSTISLRYACTLLLLHHSHDTSHTGIYNLSFHYQQSKTSTKNNYNVSYYEQLPKTR